MRIILTICFVLFVSFISHTQTTGIKWQRPIGGSSGDNSKATVVTSDSSLIIASESFSNNGDVTLAHGVTDVWVTKINRDGRTLWSKVVGSTGQDYFSGIYHTPDDGVILILQPGANNGDASGFYRGLTDVLIIKISSSGVIQWKRCIGGSSSDNFVKAVVLGDGNLIICGNTFSTDGDFPLNHGSADIFICKVDSNGNLIWNKTYGGSDSESMRDIMIKSDGSFLVSGSTLSSNSGDVGLNHGVTDLILMSISSNGTLNWLKNYGGSAGENAKALAQTGANKFACLVETNSPDGDISNYHGSGDLWVVTVDESGNILSKLTLGGSSQESSGTFLYNTPDSSILITCTTQSSDGDVAGYHGGGDIWVIKLNNNNQVLWKKCLGGSSSETLVSRLYNSDNNLIFLGQTNSNDGDVSGLHGKLDYWIGEMTAAGGLAWQKCLGGTENDRATYLWADSSGYTISGNIDSKDGDITGMHFKSDTLVDTTTRINFYVDIWTCHVSKNGSLVWEKSLGGFNNDQLTTLSKIDDDFFITAVTQSTDGDVFRNHGSSDVWVVRLGPSNRIEGYVFFDKNSNSVKDADEQYYDKAIITSEKQGYSRSAIPYQGWFKNEVDSGKFETHITVNFPYFTVIPASAQSNFLNYFENDTLLFAVQPIPNKQDLIVNLIPITAARPGFNSSYRIFYRNVGTTTISSGEILFKKDSRTTLVSSSPAVSSTNGDTLKWTYNNFAPGDTASVLVNMLVATPPTVNVGDTLSYMAIITPVATDETPANDTAVLKQRTVGAIDPNDKTENNGGLISSSFITDGSYLQYTVRFQNTGTADAINVIARDTLGNRVDLSTLEVVTASHPYTLNIENGNELTWTFNNIMLPASSVDEPGSHGYIVYRIRPKSDVVVGETIHNTASIYFDYNLPVLTNDAITLVQDNFSPLPLRLINFTGQLTNNTVQLNWQTANETNFERFEVERSFDGASFNRIGSVSFVNTNHNYKATDNVSQLSTKHIFYRLKLVDADGKFLYSKVIAFNINAATRFTVYPNPANTEMFVSIAADRKSNLQIKIIDAGGRTVSEEQKTIEKGNNVFPVNTSKLKKGNYLIQVVSGEETKTGKFIIMN